MSSNNHHLSDVVGEFYNDLNAKCEFKTRVNAENLSPSVNAVIDQLHEETMKRYYGSGLRIPENIKGARILDLGCGSGSLVFILSKLVGPNGFVVGVDLTSGLIEAAKAQGEYHWKKWGYDKSNFEFHCENIERLTQLGLELESFDIVVSNCVVCLCPNKETVFQQASAMLKPGGMFLLGDVYAEKKQPDGMKKDKKLWCMGAAGSMLWNELSPMVVGQGFGAPYLLSAGNVEIKNEELKKTLRNAKYMCAEWRMIKVKGTEKSNPAMVKYVGNITDHPNSFTWDIDLEFKKGESVAVDGVLAAILKASSFSKNFEFQDCNEDKDIATKRNQSPFQHMKELEAAGVCTKPRYTVD